MAKRPQFDPRDYGIPIALPHFRAVVAELFDRTIKNDRIPTFDELLLHPTAALLFCDGVRQYLSAPSLKESDILRALLAHRKNKQGRMPKE